MNSTCHSEYLKLASVFIKPAANDFLNEGILQSQWKDLNYLAKPNLRLAISEYSNFEKCLQQEGVHISHFPIDNSVKIDSIYCRDASIVTNFGIVICNMGKKDRVNEPHAHKQFYREGDIPILGEINFPGTVEGGDVAWIDERTLAVGHTYRTNEKGINQLKLLLEPKGIEIVVVELPHYKGKTDVFHLMSIFSPIDKGLAVVYSPLMPIKFRNELLRRGYDFVEVPDKEFESMACNVLALAPRKCLMVAGNPLTERKMLDFGCKVILYTGEEISLKGGGGPTCLTRPLLRLF